MSYFEEKMGLPLSEYSNEFLEIDAESGPWLTQSQKSLPIDQAAFPEWEIDPDEQVIWFGDGERKGVVAAIQALGTYHNQQGTWLWAWSNPKLENLATGVQQLRKDLPDLPELNEPAHECSLAKAWAMASAAAYKLESTTCFCLPGDDVSTFVAVFDVTVLEEDDPRAAVPERDPEAAQRALTEYVGPAVLHLGSLLMDAAAAEEPNFDPVISAIYAVCDNLEELSNSPVGRDTPAADEARRVSEALRHECLMLSIPPASPTFVDGVKGVLNLLRELAIEYGAWEDKE